MSKNVAPVKTKKSLIISRLSDSEILEFFPKEDFIVIFGTSNSYGSCVRNDDVNVGDENIWCSRLGNLLGYPVMNLSKPGVTNDRLIKIIADFKYYYGLQPATCILAIVEVRCKTYSFTIQSEHFSKICESTNDPNINPSIAHTKHINHSSFDNVLYCDGNQALYNAKKPHLKEYVNKHMSNENISAFRSAYEFVLDTYFSKDANTIFEYENVFVMEQLFGDIPFRWFSWNSAPNSHPYPITKDIRQLFEKRGLSDSCLFDFEVGAQMFFREKYGDAWNRERECDCAHQDAVFHKELSEYFYTELKNEFTRKNN
jgi:hypothetical protein